VVCVFSGGHTEEFAELMSDDRRSESLAWNQMDSGRFSMPLQASAHSINICEGLADSTYQSSEAMRRLWIVNGNCLDRTILKR
jgi:hypothetical protein